MESAKTLPENIADELRRDILRGVLEPGDPLKERDKAGVMGVSRTPMREAVRILAKEGLVLLRPARSAIVADPSLKEITDEIDVLQALEELSAKLACTRATDEQITRIRAQHEEMMEKSERIDSLDLFELDMAFHQSIVQAAHNPSLAQTHTSYLQRMWRVRYLSASRPRNRTTTFTHHEGIVSGLENRDAGATGDFVKAHLVDLVTSIRHRFENTHKAPVVEST